MPARSGRDYIGRLREQPAEVWLGGERIKDITTHPALRNGVHSLAALYDMQHDPALRESRSIGKSIVVKGELSGSEDLRIEGTFEGKIELLDHVLTVGEHGQIRAEVSAKSTVVFGQVVGNLTA